MVDIVSTNPFTEKFNVSALEKVKAENVKNTKTNAVDLIKNNVTFFSLADDDKDKKDEIATRVLGKFGLRGYKSVADIVADCNNTSKNQEIAKSDLESLTDSVFIAMNVSVLGDSLITDDLSPAQIDQLLPAKLKGMGEKIVEKGRRISDQERDVLVSLNKVIDENGLFISDDNELVGEFYEDLKKNYAEEDSDSFAKTYEGVLLLILEDKVVTVKKKEDVDVMPSFKNENNEWEGGSRWELSPDYTAQAMKEMGQMRWQDYTPPEWFKHLKLQAIGINTKGMTKEQIEEETKIAKARIECMVAICNGANWVKGVGPDLEKIRANETYKGLNSEKFTLLFNDDFKLVMSKLLHDLCDKPYKDQNQMFYTRYKESPDGKIKDEVLEKLYRIRGYKDELANFIAAHNGRYEMTKDAKGDSVFKLDEKGNKIPAPNWMDKMNGSTAWNMFFMFGDSSLADNNRNLGTIGELINDGIRTWNPEGKSKSKWNIRKDSLVGSEWFGGKLGTWAQTIMRLEEKMGGPISGNKNEKLLKQKILDGDFKIFAFKMAYGGLDFIYGSRNLYFKGTDKLLYKEDKTTHKPLPGQDKKETLATLLWKYADYDEDTGEFKRNEEAIDFDFGNSQADFLNLYRDQQEAATVVSQIVLGKEDIKDLDSIVAKLHTITGMVNGIEINGERPLMNYTHAPDLWANVILGSMGVDLDRLSSKHIRLRIPDGPTYHTYVRNLLTRRLKLTNEDTNLFELMKYLGVNLRPGEDIYRFPVAADVRNEMDWIKEKRRTFKMFRKYNSN